MHHDDTQLSLHTRLGRHRRTHRHPDQVVCGREVQSSGLVGQGDDLGAADGWLGRRALRQVGRVRTREEVDDPGDGPGIGHERVVRHLGEPLRGSDLSRAR